MSYNFRLVLLFFTVILASCASTPTTPPSWAATPAAIRAAYPDSDYIAQRGRGKNRAAAEANGAMELARYISSQIDATMGYTISGAQTNGKASEKIETVNTAFVKSQINLFGIRYADDAFYNKATKEWQTVAYIERAQAWQIYEPRFKRQAESFQNLYIAAENESDSFKKVLLYRAVQNYAQTSDFENANLFGQILFPAKMNAEFAAVRAQLANIPQKTDAAKRNASVFIDCPVDFESLVSGAFSTAFSGQGFPVAKTKATAAAVCAVSIAEGEQKRDIGIFYNPSLQAIVSGKSGVLWTFNAKAEKSSAVTPDVAKRRAYTALAESVAKTFAAEFNLNTLK
jgi:hypothetical protein